MRLRSWIVGGAACASIVAGLAMWSSQVQASDHDDGENDNKARSLNITDVYAFREDWQTGVAADNANLIVVFNTNPRSIARQQYYFSTNARYELHFTRVADANLNVAPTGLEDIVLRYEFGAPAAGVQPITATWIEGGTETVGTGTAVTTTLANSSTDTLTNNAITFGANQLTVFAGLREDPFFFDVESFFRMRGTGAVVIKGTGDAVDFTSGYNVNAIVTRIPIAALGTETKFDVWATVSLAMEVEDDS